jgi:hypothetical protein
LYHAHEQKLQSQQAIIPFEKSVEGVRNLQSFLDGVKAFENVLSEAAQ